MSVLKKLLLSLLALILLAFILGFSTDKGYILMARLLTTDSSVKHYDLPEKTEWRPVGPRTVGTTDTQVEFGRLLHTDTHGSDEVSLAVAPALAFDWIAEENLFVAEGPVFDRQGNIYFCPVFPPEDIIMASLEPVKGERRWALEGLSSGCGTPLVFSDPQSQKEIIYVATYDRAVAMTTDGEILWDVATGLPKQMANEISSEKHSFGVNYHRQLDALIAVMGDGSFYALDRQTGRQLLSSPFTMPGDRLPVSNFTVPNSIVKKADADIAHMVGQAQLSGNESPTLAVLHGAAGELQKVTNFFSIDQNSGRIWIAATLSDKEDGVEDGWSQWGALYGLDLEKQGKEISPVIKHVFRVKGGTASTPTISADGKRVYIADAFDSVYAVNAETGQEIWQIKVGAKVTGSLVVSADNGEIFANIREQIVKLVDRGDHAEIIWTTQLDMYEPGFLQSNFKALGAELAANGIAFTGAAGISVGKKKFPLKIGAGFIDRETGEVKYFVDGGEDSVSSMVTGPDGGMYIGNSPLRRVLGRAVLGQSKSPQQPKGGITKFKPIHLDLLIRDALWAAANRAVNTSKLIQSHPKAASQDIKQVSALIRQAMANIPLALAEGSLSLELANELKALLAPYQEAMPASTVELNRLAGKLTQAVKMIETNNT